MEQKLRSLPVMVMTVLLAAAAFFLRRSQLQNAFDAIGVIPGEGRALIWVSLAVIVIFALFARCLRGRKKYSFIASRWMPVMVASCAAAVLLVISSVMRFASMGQKSDLVIALGGLVTAVCWAGTAMFRYQGKRVNGALLLLPAVFYVVDLVLQFRLWTRDPVIMDYCFDLLALICTMFALFHLGGYSFDQGKRRVTVFFSMSGVFFSAAAMAGAAASAKLGYLAVGLWLLVNLWLLLRPVSQREKQAEAE